MQQSQAVNSRIEPALEFHSRLIISSLVTSVIAGYVAAGKRKGQVIKNAAVAGLFYFMIYEVYVRNLKLSLPFAYQIMAPLITFSFTLFGGFLRARRNAKNAHRVLNVTQPPIPPIPNV